MEKNDSWRLVNGLIALIPNCSGNSEFSEVYLSDSEKKKDKALVSKNIGTPFKEISIDDNEFFIKISNNMEVLAKCSAFPDPNKYYLIKNFYRRFGGYCYINEYISKLKITEGDIQDKKFEAVFSDKFPDQVYFVNEDLGDTYDLAFNEMERKLNCEIHKKTKKWIPGHRYDTPSETYYYLGEFLSRKKDTVNTNFLDNISSVPVMLFTNKLEKNYKKVSDIFKNEVFNTYSKSGIKINFNSILAVDSGEVLENDVQDIKNYWKELIENSINASYVENDEGVKVINPLLSKNLFDLFSIFSNSSSNDITLKGDIKKMMEVYLHDYLMQSVFAFWGTSMVHYDGKTKVKLDNNNSIDENSKSLVYLIICRLVDTNSKKYEYYLGTDGLFSSIGIDINKISKDVITEINNDPMKYLKSSDNFENYLKYYSLNRNMSLKFSKEYRSDQRSSNSGNNLTSNSSKISLKDLFVKYPKLSKVLIEMSEIAINNFGIGVDTMYSTNVGTKRNPIIYITVYIKTKDIVNHFNGASNVPYDLVLDIIDSGFSKLELIVDNNSTVN